MKKNLTQKIKLLKERVYTKNDKKNGLKTKKSCKKIINKNIINPNFYLDLRNQLNRGSITFHHNLLVWMDMTFLYEVVCFLHFVAKPFTQPKYPHLTFFLHMVIMHI